MIRPVCTLILIAALAAPALAAPALAEDPRTPVPAAATPPDDRDADGDEDAAQAGQGPHEAGGRFDYGFSGMLSRDNRTDLAPLTLSAGKPVATAEYRLKSGGYYRIAINADGSQEMALSGGDFFRAIWINEVVIDDIEIRPMGVHSIEFDDAGTATVSFVAILPGRYTLSIPGSHGESQQAVFSIQ